jgi:hypothetical protein
VVDASGNSASCTSQVRAQCETGMCSFGGAASQECVG